MTRQLQLFFVKTVAAGVALILSLPLMVCGQARAQGRNIDQFTLKGKLTGTRMDSVLLFYESSHGENLFQCQPVFNGLFIITDTINRPVKALIVFKNAEEVLKPKDYELRSRELFLEPGLLILSGDASKPSTLKLAGSQTQKELEHLDSLSMNIRSEMQPLADQYEKETDPYRAAVLATKFEPYEARIKRIEYQYFVSHPNSYLTVYKMLDYIKKMGVDSCNRIYLDLSYRLKQTPEGRYLGYMINKIDATLPGSEAMNFSFADASGKTLTLNDYRGKYVLLNFWASWSSRSREMNQHIAASYKKYFSQGLEVINIAWDDNTQTTWKAAIATDGLTQWTNLLNQTGTANDISEKFEVHFVPTQILIDPNGRIIGRYGDNNVHSDVLLDHMLTVTLKQ
ncbi:MAG TPA: TlpA disulfide reductase family protein [Mucilaginibacter sp.]|nr:TlpA disulfide reductase family protein [Mucilaginibacter sp.]